MSASDTLSLRLPRATSERLERAASLTRRSRSFLVKEALDKHLDTILKDQSETDRIDRLARILSYGGAGVGDDGGRTMEDIDAQVREFCGDE